MKLIPIPVGYKIKYQLGGRNFEGIINKVMMPGYSFHLTPDNNNILRYCVTRVDDIEFGAIIYQNMITEPNINKLYFDPQYQREMLKKFNEFKTKKLQRLDSRELLGILASNADALRGDFMVRINSKDYHISNITKNYDKIIITITSDPKYKLSNKEILDNLIYLCNKKSSISIQPCECGISDIILSENTIFLGEF